MSTPKAKILDKELKDGLENLIASLGTESDKRSNSRFVNSKRLSVNGNQDEINALYRTDWIAGKVVDIIPNDMTREWRSFTGDIDPDKIKILEKEEARLELSSTFNMAHKWARLYGTSLLVMSVDDGQLPEVPLNIDRIKQGGLKHVKAVDRHRISNAEVTPISDPLNASYGMPEFYRFNDSSVKIHHSRVLRFDGVLLPFDEFKRNNYFSDSVLDRLYEALTNLSTVTDGAASMVYETNVDIVKIKGLMGYLQSPEGEALLRKRFTLCSQLKSFNNMLLLDNEEEFTTKTNTFSGLPDLIDRYAQIITAASDVPATRLLGTSASGMNATGEGDLKNYYDKIRADQEKEYKPKLDYFDKIMAKSLGMSDEELEYEFDSLFQMTPKETSDLQLVDAQRDLIYLDRDIITEEIVAKELQQKGTYSNITDDYIEELEEAGEDDDFNTDPENIDPEQDPAEEGEESKGGENPEETGSSVSEGT